MMGLPLHQVKEYTRLRDKGESHNFAIMLATQKMPGLGNRDNRWNLRQDGKEMGVTGVRGAYQPALARYTGDPLAFCESMGDAKRRCDQLSFEEGCDVTISDGPENADNGRQKLLKDARLGDNQALATLDKELEI